MAHRLIKVLGVGLAMSFVLALHAAQAPSVREVDILLRGGRVLDGAGNPWIRADVGIAGDRIVFVGDARAARTTARDVVDVSGKLVAPGFWDVHSHAELSTPAGKEVLPLLYQGITTLVLGADGNGPNQLDSIFAGYRANGIQVNALHYVGHNAARTAAMGPDFGRPATPAEVDTMRRYVAKGMREGAIGLSSGLAYNPGFFSTTDEVVELAKVAAEYGGVYDTHDRDMGASYKGIGYLASVREAIEIAERGGTPLIFSHFSPLGDAAHHQLPEAVKMIEDARGRGVNVMAGQHVYTASSSGFIAHTLPRSAAVGGLDALLERFRDAAAWAQLRREIPELLALRGGPGKIVITDGPKEITGRSLADIAQRWNVSVPDAVRRIVEAGGDKVFDINLDIYNLEDIRVLMQKDWMMTCTDGFIPTTREFHSHPRSFGS